MRSINFLWIAFATLVLTFVNAQSNYPYSYKCEANKCTKVFSTGTPEETTLNKCRLNCGEGGTLWPLPTGLTTLSPDYSNFKPGFVNFVPTVPSGEGDAVVKAWLSEAGSIFNSYLEKMTPTSPAPLTKGGSTKAILQLRITLLVHTLETALGLNTDESYKLTIEKKIEQINVTISAATYFGARHGLETLSQLVAYDEIESSAEGLVVFAVVASANIEDKPMYPYRGLMLDTSRNFFSVPRIHKLIDGLSYNKLNIFHWHITDTHSFPMEVTDRVNMTKFGAYSPTKTYSIQEMTELVAYAKVRGVKIVVEFDAPAHTGNGWIWEEGNEELAVCVNQDPWHDFCVEPPCGQLNIANDKMYEVLGDIYKTMMGIFDKDIFHMGGDEVDLRCYNTTKVITDFMATNDWSRDRDGFMELWDHFQTKAHEEWQKVVPEADKNGLAILWTSELTGQEYITKYIAKEKYAIQIWTDGKDPIAPFLINNKYRVIFSNVDAWYLDCGFHNWIGNSGYNWCSPYRTWQMVYENSPYKLYAAATNASAADAAYAEGLLLGGVAPLWTESIDEEAVESRFWPRGSALAERLWSDPRTTGVGEAVTRIIHNRQRNAERGIQADRIQPEWCLQNEGKCISDWTTPPPTTTTSATTTTTTTTTTSGPPIPTTTTSETTTTTPSTPAPPSSAINLELAISLLVVEAIVLLF